MSGEIFRQPIDLGDFTPSHRG